MVGIYKITNKLNGKSYIGQSIHCGKRLDEHCKGDQFIDAAIQLDGIENFAFEIIKECNKNELAFWEDYYIMKYNAMFPEGYNKRWNCSEETRKVMQLQDKPLDMSQVQNSKAYTIQSFNNFEQQFSFRPYDELILMLGELQQRYYPKNYRVCNLYKLEKYYQEELKILKEKIPIKKSLIYDNNESLTCSQSNLLNELRKYINKYNNNIPIRRLSGEKEAGYSINKYNRLEDIISKWPTVDFGLPENEKVFQLDGIHIFKNFNGNTIQPLICLIKKGYLNLNKIEFLGKKEKIDIDNLDKQAKLLNEIFIHN